MFWRPGDHAGNVGNLGKRGRNVECDRFFDEGLTHGARRLNSPPAPAHVAGAASLLPRDLTRYLGTGQPSRIDPKSMAWACKAL